MSRFTNPTAVAMMKRYGKTTTTMKDRRAPRGGARNQRADIMAELDFEQADCSELLSEYEED